MQQITIPLDDQSAARLQELARQRGETLEQTAQAGIASRDAPGGGPSDSTPLPR